MIRYSGSMQAEFNAFQGHDANVIGYCQKVADTIGELNDSWHDENSNKYLTILNNALNDVNDGIRNIHNEVERYLTDVQSHLNVWGGGSSLTLPELSTISLAAIKSATTGGAWEIDPTRIIALIDQLDKTVKDANICLDSFNPTPESLANSDDDAAELIASIQSNYTAAKNCYKRELEKPFNDILAAVVEIKDIYEPRINAIKGSAQHGAGTGKDSISIMQQ